MIVFAIVVCLPLGKFLLFLTLKMTSFPCSDITLSFWPWCLRATRNLQAITDIMRCTQQEETMVSFHLTVGWYTQVFLSGSTAHISVYRPCRHIFLTFSVVNGKVWPVNRFTTPFEWLRFQNRRYHRNRFYFENSLSQYCTVMLYIAR